MVIKIKDRLSLKVRFEKDESFQHPEMIKVKIWIATYDLNLNGSNISRQAFEDAAQSLFNVPIVGEFKEKIEDFGGHGGKIVIEGDDVQIIDTTKPYGVVPESCNPRWEFDKDGVEYQVCDGYIWTGRYSEAKIIEDGNCNQSMEIVPIVSREENGVFYIDSFYYSALCILGADTQPCFPSAKITYGLNKSEFKKEFSLLLDEIKNIERSNSVNKDEILKKYEHLKNKTEYAAIIGNESLSLEDLDKQLFSLSVNDLRNRLRIALKELTYEYTYPWGETVEERKYWYEDVLYDENIVIVESTEDYGKFYGIPFSFNNDEIVLNEEGKVRYIKEGWRPFVEGTDPEPTIELFEKFTETATNKINSLSSENDENKQKCFELQEELTTVKADFSKSEEELNELRQFKLDSDKKAFEAEIDKEMKPFEAIKNVESCAEEFNKIYENRYSYKPEDLVKTMKIFCFDNGIVLSELNKEKEVKTGNGLKSFTLNTETNNTDGEWAFLDPFMK